MAARTRAVLFDFGGVFTPSPFDGAREYGARIGASPERVLELVFGPYHEDTHHPWHRLERGEIALMYARSAIVELGRAEGIDADPFKLFASMANGPQGAYHEMVERARAVLARGYRTALVTNNILELRTRSPSARRSTTWSVTASRATAGSSRATW